MPGGRSRSNRAAVHGDAVTADVYLRSVSGRTLRELATGPLPADLTPYQPSAETLAKAVRAFAELGFDVHRHALGVAVSIAAPVAVFHAVFGVAPDALRTASATGELHLPAPAAIAALVDDIVVVPAPTLFPG